MRKVRIAGLGVVAALVVVGLLQADPFARHDLPDRAPVAASAPLDDPTATEGAPAESKPGKGGPQTPAKPAEPPITYPEQGSVSYSVLPGAPETIGTEGRLLTFEIDIEDGIKGIDRTELARFVRTTYGAPQGWTAGGKWRFRQVGPGQDPGFKLMFVTPATRDILCGGGCDHYTSCRIGQRVVLNIARWVNGVPNYGASLTEYRKYMLNHETGHRLGEAHELCPGPGRPAPVMQQQTLGLHGCTPYAWPYQDGRRYEGRLGKYDDPVPGT
ncbi:DUF3152 domain-containing protein [Kribbella italica]|uniref:DUF3152 domain-containing protein n=1 Tax=Kribbella italica TaxID=1540520 RepID=A0A7W9JBH5_9ACTN|nr:DUF3152 domain-containing protein [Kribbella italica]MBB5839108.1 hypothetical protein [Kribbella italica]